MHVIVRHGELLTQPEPLIVVGSWEGEPLPLPIAELIAAQDWSGKLRQTALLYPRGVVPAQRVLLVGMGKRDDASLERVRVAAALAAQKARDLKLPSYAIAPLGADVLDPLAAAQALAEGTLLGAYRFLAFKSSPPDEEGSDLEQVVVVSEQTEALEQGIGTGSAIAAGTILARDLGNGPGNSVTPEALSQQARMIAERHGMQATILGPAELEAQGFGGLLAVAKGSAVEPRFIILEYGQANAEHPPICLVGKGITFDSGGISIKPAGSMEDMKFDMGGAGAVLGTMEALGRLHLPLHVVALISACENLPGSRAYKPGDIITTLSGKTIEVINTDAEGRIVLADALFYAQRYSPAAIIDLATLTGAIAVALGSAASGLLSNNAALAEHLLRAGTVSGERTWQMPLWDEHKEQIKSTYADIKNQAGREGGALTAAAFLAHFVGDIPWAHLDIAGTAWTGSNPPAYLAPGATGYGVRLLVEALRSWDLQGTGKA